MAEQKNIVVIGGGFVGPTPARELDSNLPADYQLCRATRVGEVDCKLPNANDGRVGRPTAQFAVREARQSPQSFNYWFATAATAGAKSSSGLRV